MKPPRKIEQENMQKNKRSKDSKKSQWGLLVPRTYYREYHLLHNSQKLHMTYFIYLTVRTTLGDIVTKL